VGASIDSSSACSALAGVLGGVTTTTTTVADAQCSRAQPVFTDGVCEWTKASVGQQAAVSPRFFAGGAGGQPLPAAPWSVNWRLGPHAVVKRASA
jgi:hypothetical protein